SGGWAAARVARQWRAGLGRRWRWLWLLVDHGGWAMVAARLSVSLSSSSLSYSVLKESSSSLEHSKDNGEDDGKITSRSSLEHSKDNGIERCRRQRECMNLREHQENQVLMTY
ncbi:hypothetical protein Dimus_024667, partial [Dionaea muscipula]